jgi:hypothetical protein
MVWFQNGKVWDSRLEAQEAMRVRGERGRRGDFRQQQRGRRAGKLEWKPRATTHAPGPKPQAPGPKPQAPGPRPQDPARRDRSWRPGGEHRDPRQKYKDAKKAKWTRFKKQIRTRWEAKQTRKKKDDE